jgi:hypothetical protein
MPLRPLLALLATLLLAACDLGEPAQQPVSVAATSTPRPTWTPLPVPPTPTATPVPPLPEQSPAEVAATLRASLDRTLAVQRYRMELSLAAKSYERRRSASAPPRLAKLMAQLDLEQKTPIITVTGEYSGDSSRTTTIYHCADCTDAADKTFDILAAGGILYLWFDADQTWYIVDDSLAADALVALEGHRLLGLMMQRVDLSTFQPSQNQQLDGLDCTVYADYQRGAINAIFGQSDSFGENEDALFQEAVNSVAADESVLRLWACADGLVRRVTLDISGYFKDDQSQAFALSQNLRLYDVDAPIAINAPPGALVLDLGDYAADELSATVFNGGNIRAEPSFEGAVLGQLNAGETVYLYEKSADGRWYYVAAPAAEGWVHSSLLTINPAVAEQVPVVPGP